jgi:hypothetical protein
VLPQKLHDPQLDLAHLEFALWILHGHRR